MADRASWKITSHMSWWSSFGKKKARGSGKIAGSAVQVDLCAFEDDHGVGRHRFDADWPNELWLTDTRRALHTQEGKLYLCAITDAYSNRVVGYSMAPRMKSSLAVAALSHAVLMRGDNTGCIVHSDSKNRSA